MKVFLLRRCYNKEIEVAIVLHKRVEDIILSIVP